MHHHACHMYVPLPLTRVYTCTQYPVQVLQYQQYTYVYSGTMLLIASMLYAWSSI